MSHDCLTYIEAHVINDKGQISQKMIYISIRSVALAQGMVPEACFGFRFCEILCGVAEHKGKTVPWTSEYLEFSPMYFLGVEVCSFEVARERGASATMINYAMGKGFTHLVLCRTGNWRPFGEGDELASVYVDRKTA